MTYQIIKSNTGEIITTIDIEKSQYSATIRNYPGCYGKRVNLTTPNIPVINKTVVKKTGNKDPMGFLKMYNGYNHYICSDGWTSGNPGMCGVILMHYIPETSKWVLIENVSSTKPHSNQFTELYGIYKQLKWIRKTYSVASIKQMKFAVMSDNKTAIDWACGKEPKNAQEKDAIIKIISECQNLLFILENKNMVKLPIDILKWRTDLWDQIPADPGRK